MKQYSQKQLKSINENFQLGQKYLQMAMYSRAENNFLDILKVAPEIIEARNALAFIYTVTKQHIKATLQLKSILSVMPNHAQTHHNLANSLYEQQLYDEAISHYQLAIELDPKFVEAYIHCGISHRMQHKYETAIQYLHQALNLDKVNARAFHVLGMIYVDIEDYPRALECLENASGLQPNNTDYRVSFASILEKASLDYEAGIQYHKACECNPTHLDAFILYGTYLQKNHRYDESLKYLLNAEQLSPNNSDIFDQIGKVYLAMGDTNAALNKFNAALESNPRRISSLLGVGQAYQDIGRLEDATKISEKIIEISPNLADGYLLKSRVKKSSPNDRLAENLLNVTSQSNLDIGIKIASYFALGKIFDDHKNFSEAFKYYNLANSLSNKKVVYDTQTTENAFNELIAFFNIELFNKLKHLGSESTLPLLIVGMPRSGSTLTDQIISSHPKVSGAGEDEFWSNAPISLPLRINTNTHYPECIRELTSEHAKKICNIYESTLRKASGANSNVIHITDKMPHNFLAVGLIALLFPKAKFIHTIRDPIDTCLSIFFQRFNNNHTYSFDLINLGHYYKQYKRLMQHWHEVLPGRILDVKYEDTIADPEYWSRKLISDIGLEWDNACLSPHKLERTVKTASHWQVRQPIYKTSVQRWKNYEQYLQPLINALNS